MGVKEKKNNGKYRQNQYIPFFFCSTHWIRKKEGGRIFQDIINVCIAYR
jgi:hypothetical protein